MAYYTYLFSPDTHEAFVDTPRDNVGVRERHQNAAERLQPGDMLVCYLTRVSRWLGLLRVVDGQPFRADSHDPYVVRLRVEPVAFAVDMEHDPDPAPRSLGQPLLHARPGTRQPHMDGEDPREPRASR